ncbi:SDR family NAD(P)-dependent oxidoreductase [Ensifer adhaerens]|uniref:SDR family NAD(P)-dependent oxidoreductase n=1 Tax=Ensifer adhaerens TaxID=106592 RepID=UPI000DE458D4|nr:SDR family NAD(P)-dependent oxidoreductase [Ensifer adhaerens]UTV40903.1 SDR family NAD(P)-dependent oxidoreductase [Ensifer adhaerens]
MSPSSSRYGCVVITGAGNGVGREIALGFSAKGYIVFGTAMSAEEACDLRDASGGRVSLTVCDVTKTDAVRAWAGGVSDALGDTGLDVLINNAAHVTRGAIEVLSLDAIRHEFDVNVFGAVNVINTFLPALRKAHGRIVQISTWSASVPLPFNGPSDASQAALEVLSAVYRAELKPFGIDVVVASVGTLDSPDASQAAAALQRVADSMTSDQRKLYGKRFRAFADGMSNLQASGLDTSEAAARIIEVAEQRPLPIRAMIGRDAEEILRTVRDKSDEELEDFKLKLVGLN